VASGTPSQLPFAIYDPISCCWKTLLSSGREDSDRSKPTWPAAGTTRNGSAYAHPRWAPPIEERDASPGSPENKPSGSLTLLPTPQARDGDGRGACDPATRRAQGHSVGLDDAVSVLPNHSQVVLLPTPRASHGAKGSPNQHGSKGDLMLTSAIARLARHPGAPIEQLPDAA
jgi:hypothetical protein